MNHFHQSNSKTPTRESGITWYRKFTIRNKNKIENRRGETQHQIRKYWTTHENFVTMYDRVHAEILDAKVTTPLEESECYFTNIAVSRFNTEEEAEGHQTKHCISHT